MKVLNIIDSLEVGGAQFFAKWIFEARLDKRDVFLYALRLTSSRVSINHPNVLMDPCARRFSLEPLSRLRRLIRKEGIEVLHCQLFRSQVFGWVLKRLFFPPGSVAELVERIESLRKNPALRERLVEKGCTSVRSYARSHPLRRLEELYRFS